MKRSALVWVSSLLVVGVGCAAAPAPRDTTPTVVAAPTPPPVEDRKEIKLADAEIEPNTPEPAPDLGIGTQAAVQGAFDSLHTLVTACYKDTLSASPGANGRIEVEVDLLANGTAESVRVFPEEGLDALGKCMEATLKRLEVKDAATSSTRVVRAYHFTNPMTNLAIETAFAVPAPARARRKPRRGAAAATPPANATTASANATPATGPLTTDEVSSVMNVASTGALQACYVTLLGAQRGATGTAKVHLELSTAGAVTKAEVTELNITFAPQRRRRRGAAPADTATPARDALKTCTEQGLNALQFRAASTPTAVNAALAFGAQPAAAPAAAATPAAAGSEPAAAPHGRRHRGHH